MEGREQFALFLELISNDDDLLPNVRFNDGSFEENKASVSI